MSVARAELASRIRSGTRRRGTPAREPWFLAAPIGSEASPERRRIHGLLNALGDVASRFETGIVAAHQLTTVSLRERIFERLRLAELVISDLTELNPNVLFEAGFRAALDRPLILIARVGTEIPFDLSTQLVTFYRDDLLGTADLVNTLSRVVADTLHARR